jgi:Tfp pilus assembly pilus retraction ATPase PilT
MCKKKEQIEMPANDQLTKNERLRLECFAQAVNSSFTLKTIDGARPKLEDLFEQARQIEAFLKASNPN